MAESLTLPRALVERIFLRLQGVYGSQFTAKYLTGEQINGRDIGYENAMQVWSEELCGLSDHPDSIAYALKNLDAKFPPNAREFLDLCRRAPAKALPALPAPDPNPERAASFANDAKKITDKRKDFIAWARRPKSAMAFGAVLDLIARGESQFEEILQDLRTAGHVVGETLVHRWDGSQWVKV